jgi:hypothetical protein
MPGKGAKTRGGIALISPEASRVAERANIREIRLFETSAELKSFTTESPLHWDLGITRSTQYKQGDPYFVITIEYEITIEKLNDPSVEGAGDDSEEVADISFQFGVLYELEPDSSNHEITSEEVEEYAKTAAAITLTPYAREYVHDVTMRMGLPPLVMDALPSFFAEEKVESARDSDQDAKDV